ncbi:MAG: hypothetical protein ACR2I0_06080, partial [Rhodoferax sp.]
ANAQGLQLSASQQYRLAQQVASSNHIGNADRIYAGQHIDLGTLQQEFQALQTGRPAPQASTNASTNANANATASVSATAAPRASASSLPSVPTQPATAATLRSLAPIARSAHPVLELTLNRAVSKGYIAPAHKAAVFNKIVQMGGTHRFAPDDFARMTLMESDGMNPRASNQHCHGIIQFCDGPGRGAASAGLASNPMAILNMNVPQQLELVDRYFTDVGLKNKGSSGLEDLYLSVLHPAARNEGTATSALNIPGAQSRKLYVDGDSGAPITRQSIRQGLLHNAAERLGQLLPAALQPRVQRIAQYVDATAPGASAQP